MKKRLKTLAATALVAAAGMVGSSTASALSIAPAGPLVARATNFTWTVNGITLTCATSTLGMTLASAGTGQVTSAAFNTCSQATLGTWTLTPVLPWTMQTTATTDGVATTLSNIVVHYSSAIGCRFTVSGSQTIRSVGPSPLTVSTWPVSPSGSRLVLSNSTGCLGLMNNGNAMTWSANYALSTPQTITYP